MAETRCAGLRLISPVNKEVTEYSIKAHGFTDLTGDGAVLYREAAELFTWFQQEIAQTDDEH